MKDEEMAKEWFNKELYLESSMNNLQIEYYCRQAFLAGLKAGRPQWHDLRKDSTDIPPMKDKTYSIEVWVKDAKGNYGTAVFSYALLEDDGKYDHWIGTTPVLWTELPTYDEE